MVEERAARRCRPLYAIGDIHGDADRLLKLLVAHDLISIADGAFEWTKRDVIVIFMGDVLDAKSRIEGFGDAVFENTKSDLWVLEFIRIAAQKASACGSCVHALLGDHELRNICHDFQDTSPHHNKDVGARKAYFRRGGAGFESICQTFLTSITYNRVLYSHAGLPLSMSDTQKRIVNKKVSPSLFTDEYISDAIALVKTDVYAREPLPAQQESLNVLLRRRGADRMVVGHYFTNGYGIFAGWGGKVVYTDVGISRAYAPTATALSSCILYDDGSGDLRVLDLSGQTHEIRCVE